MIKNILIKRILLILLIPFSIIFCGGNRLIKSEKNQPFISEEFPKLTKIESSKDTIIYRYMNPNLQEYTFSSVLLDPISINQNQIDPKITPTIDKITVMVEESIKSKLAQKSIKSSDGISESTARVSVLITGVKIKPDGIKPWNLLPLSALITATIYVAGYNSKTIDLLMECKITNSETNELLSKDVITISSDKFRNKNKTLDVFSLMSDKALDELFNLSIHPIFNK
jgi:hypothetical protein